MSSLPELFERSGRQAAKRVLRHHLGASTARASRCKRDHQHEARSDAAPDPALRCNDKAPRYSPAQGLKATTSSAAAASTGTLVSGLSDKAAKPRASEDMLGFSMNTQGLPLRLQWFFTRQ